MSKTSLNARVKITAGPAAGLWGRIASVDESTWSGNVALDDGRTAKGIPLKHLEVIDEVNVDGDERTKLLDRIRKLHAKAESAKAIGNEAEAMAFAQGVAKMLNKYRLSLDDLAMEALERDEPIEGEWTDGRGGKLAQWYEQLASVVARAHFCRCLFSTRASDSLFLVGRSTDRKIANFVIVALARTADELSDKAARQFRKQQRREVGKTTYDNKNYRTAWLTGFVERIAERYREETERTEREQKATGGTSLVLVQTKSLAQIDQYIKASVVTVSRRGPKAKHAGINASEVGRQHGRAAANSANIRGTGLGASTQHQKSIGGTR